jgi:hypothetical protein
VICFWVDDDFIRNNTLQLHYHDDMVNARNGHYEPITFYNASWEVDQNMLPQTKHTNQSTKMSIKQWGQKWFLPLYGIDDNMHPCQKQKFEVSHENVIEKPKRFHWNWCTMTIKKINDYISIFHLKKYNTNFFINNSTSELRYIQVYSHLCHLHKKNVNIVKNINSCLNNIESSTNPNVGFNDIPQTHSLEQHSHENPQYIWHIDM